MKKTMWDSSTIANLYHITLLFDFIFQLMYSYYTTMFKTFFLCVLFDFLFNNSSTCVFPQHLSLDAELMYYWRRLIYLFIYNSFRKQLLRDFVYLNLMEFGFCVYLSLFVTGWDDIKILIKCNQGCFNYLFMSYEYSQIANLFDSMSYKGMKAKFNIVDFLQKDTWNGSCSQVEVSPQEAKVGWQVIL